MKIQEVTTTPRSGQATAWSLGLGGLVPGPGPPEEVFVKSRCATLLCLYCSSGRRRSPSPLTGCSWSFTDLLYSTEPSGLLGTGCPGRPPRLSHSSWALHHSIQVQSQDCFTSTPLYSSSKSGLLYVHTTLFKFKVRIALRPHHSVQVQSQDCFTSTPLCSSSKSGLLYVHTTLFKFKVRIALRPHHSVQVQSQDCFTSTPLYSSSKSGLLYVHTTLFKFKVRIALRPQHSIQVQSQDCFTSTPLYSSSKSGLLYVHTTLFKFKVRIALRPHHSIQVQSQDCFTSTETVRLIRDKVPRTATSTFTQLLSFAPRYSSSKVNVALRPQKPSGLLGTDFHTAPELCLQTSRPATD